MKKIKLKKSVAGKPRERIGYKINYENELNVAQYEAVMHNNGAALVIAGAGTGKTRTLVYRVARLIEDGVPPQNILLLTFTRKSAAEMLRRASILLDGRCDRVSGGTFHSFGVQVLRRHAESIGYDINFSILDQSDSEDVINLLRTRSGIIPDKRRFPQKQTLQRIYSMSVNKRSDIAEIIKEDYPHFSEETDRIGEMIRIYNEYKKKYNLMDYDDLLLNVLRLMKDKPGIAKQLSDSYKYLMVDEYQDTNRLQHEIVLRIAGKHENVMAVGDDAQSIYAFRGANFQNIMFFPESFSNCEIFKIEENYRSTQPILDLTNEIIKAAIFKYDKGLYTNRPGGELPKLISAVNERQQSLFLVQQILELNEQGISLNDIAVLFRSAFHSFDLEIELNRANIPYQKFGGIKFSETAHVKDLIAYLKILQNPKDAVSWQRILLLMEGIGPATAGGIVEMIAGDELNFFNTDKLSKYSKVKSRLEELFRLFSKLKEKKYGVGEKTAQFADHYRDLMKNKYDDWKKRWKDIEMFLNISERYNSINTFLNDMAIEPPLEAVDELTPESKEEDLLNLSTIHSAKGLEFRAVFLMWALEGRFPSSRAVDTIDTVEEERRLFYVACTRAKDELFITYPTNIYDRESGFVLSSPSRFIREIDEQYIDKYVLADDDEED
ncbi:MAG: ATP-dependent helicase [Candidatus Kapaibacterium sp.]